MSVRVLSWVWEHGPTDQTELLVLLALADFCDDQGQCYPSMASIGRKARLTERGARGVIRRLEAGGWLAVHVNGGRGGANRYQIMRANPEPETRNDKPGMSFPPAPDDTKPGTSLHKTRNQRSAEPSGTVKEPSKSLARDAREVMDSLRRVLSQETAEAFIEHRKAKRAKLTAKAAILIARKLADHPDPDAVAEESILNGWTGIFPERTQGPKGTPHGKRHSAAQERVKRVAARFEAGYAHMAGGED